MMANKIKIEVKNADGTVNKKETARIKENTRRMENERKTDMFGKSRKKRITEVPRDALIKGVRNVMSVIPGQVGKRGKEDLMLNRMAKEVDKNYLEEKSKGGSLSGSKLVASFYKGGRI
tara:strand:- start:14 stop:370 length:357 start_codon:yes stop_codon:yes gene_type:complete